MKTLPDLWNCVFEVAEFDFGFDVGKYLKLVSHWDEHDEFPVKRVKDVIAEVCAQKGLTLGDYWKAMKERLGKQKKQANLALVEWGLFQEPLLEQSPRHRPGLPDEATLAKVQRYESHLSREFYRALHEPQRLQAARFGLHPAVPAALDISVDSDRRRVR